MTAPVKKCIATCTPQDFKIIKLIIKAPAINPLSLHKTKQGQKREFGGKSLLHQ
jgi:hypothetical protein